MKLSLALTIVGTVVTSAAATEYCDNGFVGSGICKDPEHCCSKWGWCGTTSTHCDPATCVSGPNCPNGGNNPSPTSPPIATTPVPTTATATPAPTNMLTPVPTLAPTSPPTSSPTNPPTPTPTNGGGNETPCGNGVVGNGICENPCECCSGWGWCSSLPAYCAADSCISSPDNSCTRPEAIFHDKCNAGSPPTSAPLTPAPTPVAQTQAPVASPTNQPTSQPIPAPVPVAPTVPVTLSPVAPTPPSEGAGAAVETVLENSKVGIDNELFMYENPSGQWEPSSVYRYQGFMQGLRVMYQQGVNGKQFYMGDDSANGHEYGLVNIASFLAQSMKETIKYDACDENSWDLVNGVYPLSNACGQLGQSYEDYHCSEEEAYMECPADPTMSITATTNAKWYGAPGPLKCGPTEEYPVVGFWDHSAECNKPWDNPPSYCEAYEGQKAGLENNDAAVANRNGRTDVEGCCWWGRGVIQTTGVCNFGKLNYFLGKRAFDEGRESPYPTIDFCQDPGAICASEEFTELKWIAGMFYWMESVQTYDSEGWNYMTELHTYVDGGMTDDSFVNAVSGIVNRGCHNPPCASGPVDGEADRRDNFYNVLQVFSLRNRRGLRA